MTTETLVTSGQTDTATDSSQTATGATDNQTGAQTDAQQQQSSTDTTSQQATGATDQGATADGDKSTDDKPAGAPEQYEDFTAPDGVQLDAEVTGDLKALAKELNLPQEQAQKVADLGAKLAQKWQAQQATSLTEASAKWADETRADPEFGGDKLNESLASAKKALTAFGSPKLATLLNESGLGNHPEIIALLARTGKAISEDRIVTGNAAPAPKDAKSFYSNSQMN
jgi:hypothetical protein